MNEAKAKIVVEAVTHGLIQKDAPIHKEALACLKQVQIELDIQSKKEKLEWSLKSIDGTLKMNS